MAHLDSTVPGSILVVLDIEESSNLVVDSRDSTKLCFGRFGGQSLFDVIHELTLEELLAALLELGHEFSSSFAGGGGVGGEEFPFS